MRALAVTTSKRMSAPNVPTLERPVSPATAILECAVRAEGIAAAGDRPHGRSPPRWRRTAVQKQMANFGSAAVANTPAEFAKMLRETKLWATW